MAVPHRALVVGDGPVRPWIEERAPQAVYAGFLKGEELARAYASAAVMFNPSSTETFGNTTLEAMASRLPAVARRDPGLHSSRTIGVNGVHSTAARLASGRTL